MTVFLITALSMVAGFVVGSAATVGLLFLLRKAELGVMNTAPKAKEHTPEEIEAAQAIAEQWANFFKYDGTPQKREDVSEDAD